MDYRLLNPVCKFCSRKRHIEGAWITKQKSSKVSLVTKPTIIKLDKTTTESSPSIPVIINNRKFPLLVDTGASCSSCTGLHGRRLEHRYSRKTITALLSKRRMTSFQLPGQTDLKVTVTTKYGHIHSQVLPFTLTDELFI